MLQNVHYNADIHNLFLEMIVIPKIIQLQYAWLHGQWADNASTLLDLWSELIESIISSSLCGNVM